MAGDGGTDLADPIQATLNGMKIERVAISSSSTQHEFGYTVLNRNAAGWSVDLKSPAGATLVHCRIARGRVLFALGIEEVG